MKIGVRAGLMMLGWALGPALLRAQGSTAGIHRAAIEPTRDAALPAPGPASRVSDGTLVFAGLAGGVIGFFAGGSAGAVAFRDRCEDCGLAGAVWGATAGVSAGIPLAVHLANRRRGSYGTSLGAAIGIGAAGLAAAFALNDPTPLLVVPVGQIVTSIAIERGTEK